MVRGFNTQCNNDIATDFGHKKGFFKCYAQHDREINRVSSHITLVLLTVLIAVITANIGEYTSSTLVEIFKFSGNPPHPPNYLIFGSWPLEVLVPFYFAK